MGRETGPNKPLPLISVSRSLSRSFSLICGPVFVILSLKCVYNQLFTSASYAFWNSHSWKSKGAAEYWAQSAEQKHTDLTHPA